MKKILIIIPLFLLFGCGGKEAEIKELEKRGGTTFHCPVYYEKDTIGSTPTKTKEVVYTRHKAVKRSDDFYKVSPDPQSERYEPDPWKRSGDTWLITLYPPDRVLIHQRIRWQKWGNGIKKSIDHYFSEITYRNALLGMNVYADDSSLYEFDKVGLNFGRRSFILYSSGGLLSNFGDEMYECKEIDKTTLSEKIQEHENRLIIDEKLIQEKEEEEESKNKI